MATTSLTSAERTGGTASRRRIAAVDAATVGVGALATLALVLPTYARRPFWFDELVSVEVASGFSGLVEYVATVEANMALYHGLLHAWLQVTESEAGVRVLSVVFALLALPFAYALARRLFDRRTAIVAVLLLSVNVSFVGHARDARSYALTLLLVTAASYALVRAVDRSSPRAWALYGAAAGLAVWAHLLAALVVVAHVSWLALERRSRPLGGVSAGLLVLTALVAPLVLVLIVGGQQPQLDWLPKPGPQSLPGLFQWYVESRATVVLYFLGAAYALVAAGLAWRRGSPPPRAEILLLLWLLVPPALAFLASYVTPVYLYRYFLASLPALVLLVAAGFVRLRPAWLGLGLAAAAVALSVQTVRSCQPDCKLRHDDFRAAAAYLEARARPGDALVAYPAQVRTPFDHYLGATRPRLAYPERWPLVGGEALGADDLARAAREATRHDRVWLVTWWLPSERARDALSERGALLFEREFAGNVRVELFRVRTPT